MKLEMNKNEKFIGCFDEDLGVALYAKVLDNGQVDLRVARLSTFEQVAIIKASSTDDISHKLSEVVSRYSELFLIPIPEPVEAILQTMFKGNKALIETWLHKPKYPLGNKKPIELLKTTKGTEQVLDMLNKISRGDMS